MRRIANGGEMSAAGGPVAAGEGIDEAPALEALDGHLARQRAPRRAAAEGRALDRPGAVVVALEVGDHDVGRCARAVETPAPIAIQVSDHRTSIIARNGKPFVDACLPRRVSHMD